MGPLSMESDEVFNSGIPRVPIALRLVEGIYSHISLKERTELAHRGRVFC